MLFKLNTILTFNVSIEVEEQQLTSNWGHVYNDIEVITSVEADTRVRFQSIFQNRVRL